ncbi:MAG: DinB family protein [Flavobacteriales bacterium]|nr:DinB family protein [Flavobacteriales bacterium]
MEINQIEPFLDYYSKVRKRTLRVIACIPEDKIEWTYQRGKFTFGDLIRHIACIERHMYAESALFKPSRYAGCGTDLAEGYSATVQLLNDLHAESMKIFSKLTEEDLQKKTETGGRTPITLWKWLRLMAEHEIHHRGQLYLYLSILGLPSPPLYGLTSEEVRDRRAI